MSVLGVVEIIHFPFYLSSLITGWQGGLGHRQGGLDHLEVGMEDLDQGEEKKGKEEQDPGV